MQFSPRSAAFEVGEPARTDVGRAAYGSLLLGTTFVGLSWAMKETPGIYARQPWQNDPYHALVSFDFAGIPLLLGFCLVRLALCRRDQPLPARRVVDLLGGCRALVGLVAVTLAAEWIAVALRADHGSWNAVTVASQPDWLADAIALGEREARRLGPGRDPARSALRWIDAAVVRRVREHPVAAAAGVSVALGVAGDVPQIVLEGYSPALAVLFMSISACALFAFVVIVGSRLHIVDGSSNAGPAVHAVVVAALSVALAAGFRNPLWALVGVDPDHGGVGDLAQLVVGAALLGGTLTVLGERLVRRLAR